ncbi:hypothetical protein BGAL_0015g00200 [Botrytis galanthina]|uniref:Uncharacterized protein n=1 Tax=Botrytis galanthina TaxID=278940 RepID=A0A4S8REM5_9HELO|nr:hypothetical protein BGAL_0015g00200 [Botrytis galanthina]
MSSNNNNNNNNGKGTGKVDQHGPFFADIRSSSENGELVLDDPKKTGSLKKPQKTSSTRTGNTSTGKPVTQIKDDTDSNSDRRRANRNDAYKDLTGHYPSSSDSDKVVKGKGKGKGKEKAKR